MTNQNTDLVRPAKLILSDQQRLSWLRLYRSENVGPATFRDLINHCGSAGAALEMLPNIAERGGRRKPIRIASETSAERELEAIHKHGAKLISIGEPGYPNLLRLTDMSPPLITVMGNPEAMENPSVSIVGSRNASMVGIKLARTIAAELGKAGKVVVSGLARGIDAAAHEASIETGTVGVLAGGIDKPYPPENLALFRSIVDSSNSCVVTEMPFGWQPRARDFPRRNRLIAALSLGLLVVEAAQRSGSLISARLANELGRTVFAIPGSPLDPRSHGTNNLIREGATLATSAADIIEGLRHNHGAALPAPAAQHDLFEADDYITLPPDENAREAIIALLSPSPTDVDDIIAHTGLKPAQVALVILELDIAGQIERHSGNRVSLI